MTEDKSQEHKAEGERLLRVKDLSAGYDGSAVIRQLSISIHKNEVVAFLGRNGVGKSTLLKCIMGLMPISAGSITFDDEPIHTWPADKRARLGIGYVPQGRDIFPNLTVWENLKVSLEVAGTEDQKSRLDEVYTLFPALYDMLKRKGGVLSGGQQQQLAIGRALLTNPRLLILDEPTEGIQPSIVDQIEDAIKTLKTEKTISIILVEQYLDFAKAASDYFYIMDRGSIVEKGKTTGLTDQIITKYLTV